MNSQEHFRKFRVAPEVTGTFQEVLQTIQRFQVIPGACQKVPRGCLGLSEAFQRSRKIHMVSRACHGFSGSFPKVGLGAFRGSRDSVVFHKVSGDFQDGSGAFQKSQGCLRGSQDL